MNSIKETLINKYGTLTNAATKLNIDESTLHRNLKRLTPKFAFRLRKLGIIIPDVKSSPRKNVVIIDNTELVIAGLRKQISLLEKLLEEKERRIKELERGI